ncbi:PREDICTED: kinesin-like protein KIF13A, partial [Tinamus guttatus]|uniref:kinesin-like protein KIF13A n=1 Tax=Tinamus guttatus TaxID=94827 RepID=UPI00052EB562
MGQEPAPNPLCPGGPCSSGAASSTGGYATITAAKLELNTKCVVEMEGNQTVLHPPPASAKQGE